MFLKNASVAVPPNNPLQTPGRTSSEAALREEKTPACLIVALLFHIHLWIQGEDSLKTHPHIHTHTHKESNSKKALLCVWRPVWCLQGCTVKEKKKQRHTTEISFMAPRFQPPVDSPLCINKKVTQHRWLSIQVGEFSRNVTPFLIQVYKHLFKSPTSPLLPRVHLVLPLQVIPSEQEWPQLSPAF